MLCIIKDLETGYFYGKQYNEGYYYSEYTNSEGSVDPCWKTLQFFIGPNEDESCGLAIFESKKSAVEYMKKEWNRTKFEVVLIKDLEGEI